MATARKKVRKTRKPNFTDEERDYIATLFRDNVEVLQCQDDRNEYDTSIRNRCSIRVG